MNRKVLVISDYKQSISMAVILILILFIGWHLSGEVTEKKIYIEEFFKNMDSIFVTLIILFLYLIELINGSRSIVIMGESVEVKSIFGCINLLRTDLKNCVITYKEFIGNVEVNLIVNKKYKIKGVVKKSDSVLLFLRQFGEEIIKS